MGEKAKNRAGCLLTFVLVSLASLGNLLPDTNLLLDGPFRQTRFQPLPENDVTLTCPEGIQRPFSAAGPKVYQLSAKFGYRNKFRRSVQVHTQRSVETGIFDEVFGYYEFPEFILNDTQWKRNLEFLADPRHISKTGGGYWFWKATLIYHHLKRIRTGDFLVYVDNDVVDHWIILKPVLQDMVDQNKNFVMMEMPENLERMWTKRDVYHAYCAASPEKETRAQSDAMFLVLRKDEGTLQLARQFAEGVKNWHALSDEPSWIPNFEFFKDHRRDQSILNAIVKCRYREPGRRRYDQKCNWGVLQMYSIPVWNESLVVAVMNETWNVFSSLERLHGSATVLQRKSPHDSIWTVP